MTEEQTMPIDTLAPAPKNPRKIKADAAAGLGASLELYGALDIVFNLRSGHLVSGHQRVKALATAGATQVHRSGEWGYILHPRTDERFPVRFVDWDDERERMANLVANNPHIQGEFTVDALETLDAMKGNVAYEVLMLGALNTELLEEFTPDLGGDGDGDKAPTVKRCTCPNCGHEFEV